MATGYQSRVLDHLGLVAAMYDELGIGKTIDHTIKQDASQRKVSIGQAVKSMVLNGLGFVNQSLYLVPVFFDNKPTERLIGEGILPKHLNDDVLGRALDQLFEHDVTTLYSLISQKAVQRLGLGSPRYGHLDTTSFHVDGVYNSEQTPEEGVIHITKGYSRDHRPDLNQVGLELIVENQAGVPLLMEPLSGNSSDKAEFNALIKTHTSQLQQLDYLIADSALYTKKNIQDLSETKWITRVPETLTAAKSIIQTASSEVMVTLDERYKVQEFGATYGHVKQRWVLVESEPARYRALKTVNRRFFKGSEQEEKDFQKLGRKEFACSPDAEQALIEFQKKARFITIEQAEIISVPRYASAGRPKNGEQPSRWIYQIIGAPSTSIEKREALLVQKSRFILATNELDESRLPCQKILEAYKGQGSVERGFRFLKDPLFLASSIFLKSPKRIMALLMVMTVCLLVYTALEFRIRKSLEEQNKTVPNQKGKPIQQPTMRWIFQMFTGIHLLLINEQNQVVLNLNEKHEMILTLMGKSYEKLYS